MSNLADLSCREFNHILSSKTPTPGGGGAAALSGALSASLGLMVSEYTLGKKAYEDYEADVKEIIEILKQKRDKLIMLIDEDAEAFLPLSKAYALPKDDPKRDKILFDATVDALQAPLNMLETLEVIMDKLYELLDKGSRMLLSDTVCAAHICMAAMESAAVNVYVNTATLSEVDLVDSYERKCEDFLTKARKIETEITVVGLKKIRGK